MLTRAGEEREEEDTDNADSEFAAYVSRALINTDPAALDGSIRMCVCVCVCVVYVCVCVCVCVYVCTCVYVRYTHTYMYSYHHI